jgi:hypothetical protein
MARTKLRRSTKKRGPKAQDGHKMPDPQNSRKAKNAAAQAERVKELREKRDERLSEGVEGQFQVAFTRKLQSLAAVGGLHSSDANASADAPEYGLVDIVCLNKLLAEAPDHCPSCNSQERCFVYHSGNDNGLAMRPFLVCQGCDSVLTKGYSSRRIDGGNTQFDINKRSVFAMRMRAI